MNEFINKRLYLF